jgi:hypothetical protein
VPGRYAKPMAAEMSIGCRPAVLYVAAVLVVGATCGGLSQEVRRERAIDVARQHVSLPPTASLPSVRLWTRALSGV